MRVSWFSLLCTLSWSSLVFPTSDVTDDYRQDEITYLPGLPWQPSFKQYSGYLRAAPTRLLHYWLVESERSPETDPVVLWLNGGPGCSSLNGFFTELGPFLIIRGNKGKYLRYNDYAWNKIANVLYLESPAGVGFSYATDGNYQTGDDQTADDNYRALLYFFEKFPHFRGREFIITGESYAGVYIPTLMDRFLNDTDGHINLRGAMIGNGLLSGYIHTYETNMFYWYTHAMMSNGEFQDLQKYCCGDVGTEQDCHFIQTTNRDCLSRSVEQVFKFVTEIPINRYNIYSPCLGWEEERTNRLTQQVALQQLALTFDVLQGHDPSKAVEGLAMASSKVKVGAEEPSGFVPCTGGEETAMFLRRDDVIEAIHVRKPQEYGMPSWEGCSSIVDDDKGVYVSTYPDMLDIMARVTASKKYDVMIYYGDADTMCSFLTGKYVIREVAHRSQLQRLRDHQPWRYTASDGSSQIGGFLEEYENFIYLTFKGSGHMVPTDQPIPALDILRRYIDGTIFSKKTAHANHVPKK